MSEDGPVMLKILLQGHSYAQNVMIMADYVLGFLV